VNVNPALMKSATSFWRKSSRAAAAATNVETISIKVGDWASLRQEACHVLTRTPPPPIVHGCLQAAECNAQHFSAKFYNVNFAEITP